jgi:twitching motility protein PilT
MSTSVKPIGPAAQAKPIGTAKPAGAPPPIPGAAPPPPPPAVPSPPAGASLNSAPVAASPASFGGPKIAREVIAEALAKISAMPQVEKEPEVNKIFRLTLSLDASDLHLKVGQPPMMRIRGDITRMEGLKPLSQEDMERLLGPLMSPRQKKIMDDEGGVDFSYVVGNDEIRFRVSLFRQRGRWSLVTRRVNSNIPSFEKLGLPPIIESLCKFSEGLVILAGVTGSGKSTTIAAMLDYVNATEPLHILTVEDPIEFVFADKMAYINQREIGLDSKDWHKALKDAVRQDPDVILVGELRDVETFEAAVHAAETGHLVFGTIHASSASTTINRILDLFPPEKHGAIRQALANNLKAIIAQKLVKGLKKPRCPTNEIMIVNPIVKKLMSEGEDSRLGDAIRMCHQEGMQDFTESLRSLCERGDIDRATALEYAPNPEQLKMALKGIKVSAPGIL